MDSITDAKAGRETLFRPPPRPPVRGALRSCLSVMSSELHKYGHMVTGHRLFCKEILCFNTLPCRHMPLLVHFFLMSGILPDGMPARDLGLKDP